MIMMRDDVIMAQDNDALPLALTNEWHLPCLNWGESQWSRVVRCCDAVRWLEELPPETVDLVYIDPPFASGKTWSMGWKDGQTRSFNDYVSDVQQFAEWLSEPLRLIHRVLKESGSVFVHLDWHAVHYVKIAMDQIFGYDNFKNEVIWAYRTAGNSKRHFARKHDNILFYCKNQQKARFFPQKQRSYLKKHYGYGDHYRENYDPESQQYYTEVLMRDVWTDIPALKGCNRERVGYPTQKPLALLKRVITAVTEPGDVVADFFCGSGTTLVAAAQLQRRFFGCDISPDAVQVTRQRLQQYCDEGGQTSLFLGGPADCHDVMGRDED